MFILLSKTSTHQLSLPSEYNHEFHSYDYSHDFPKQETVYLKVLFLLKVPNTVLHQGHFL